MTRLISIVSAGALAATLAIAGGAAAEPDIDGAVDALIDTPFNTLGDAAGSAGLVAAGIGGAVGDLVALIDKNEHAEVLLRGIVSTSIHRLSLGLSNTFTGMLEGMRAENLQRYPESASAYLDPADLDSRVDNVLDGLGGVWVGVTDAVGNPLLFLLRCAGAAKQADQISDYQAEVRDRYFGSVSSK